MYNTQPSADYRDGIKVAQTVPDRYLGNPIQEHNGRVELREGQFLLVSLTFLGGVVRTLRVPLCDAQLYDKLQHRGDGEAYRP